MKSLNAKRIAAIVTGAALLGAGLAFAGPLTFQNVPIISNSGQPVVQVVIGSGAKPSDGVAAGNIAAAIGNLAYTSTPVTAMVNPASENALKVSVSSAQYSLTNQQVWLNESGVTSATGSSYLFSALIGSVLNQGVQLGSPQFTKTLQANSNYAFNQIFSTTTTPSPFTAVGTGSIPTGGTIPQTSTGSGSNTGGGVNFNSFSSGSWDNILQVTNSQFSSLANNFGANQETENLFLTGFPVFDQANSGSIQNKFAILGVGGAYVATFNKPVQKQTSSGSNSINVPIRLLGQDFTIVNESGVGTISGSGATAHGGTLSLAASVAPLSTVYVGHNITSGPWTVQLQDLAQTTNGLNAPAAIAVYYNGVQTNETTIDPQANPTVKVNVTGNTLFINVQATFAGLYAYQKWAKIQLYAGVYNLRDGRVFNSTNDNGWYVNLLWQNQSGTSGGNGNALRSIVIYNYTPTQLTQGQSFTFIQNPAAFKLTFIGDTLGNNYDQVMTSLGTGSVTYANGGSAIGTDANPTNVTEPAELLTLQSGIGGAFQYGGQTSSQITYVLTPYTLSHVANAPTPGGANVVLSYTSPGAANFISLTHTLTVQVKGFKSAADAVAGSNYTEPSVTFNSPAQTMPLPTPLYSVTTITLQNGRAFPVNSVTAFSVTVNDIGAAGNVLSSLDEVAPLELLSQTNGYNKTTSTAGTIYNQQNGQQTPVNLNLGSGSAGNVNQFYTFSMSENPVPQNALATDALGFGIYNTTGSQGQSQLLQANYSTNGQHNNATYTSTQSLTIPVQTGFKTEKGSTVASISPSGDTFDMATSVDQLQFALTNTASNAVISKAVKTFGPYTVGQATNLPNVTIAAVNASVTLSGTAQYSISGIENLTATPNVAQATVPVLLKNLSSTAPLVVLDSNANQGSNLILVGSGYVNSLSQQLETAYTLTGQIAPGGSPIAQAYGGNRILVAGYSADDTLSAANSFIDQLYTLAATSG